MSQIMYNYPAMLGHAGDMSGYAGTLQGLGADIASEQAALSNSWQGDTGMTYQGWQAQWNQAMEDLVRAHQSMAGTHEANTMAMLARDTAEAAKWAVRSVALVAMDRAARLPPNAMRIQLFRRLFDGAVKSGAGGTPAWITPVLGAA